MGAPKASVTILAPNHYYMIKATQGNLEHNVGTLWARSRYTRRSLRVTFRKHVENIERLNHFGCRVQVKKYDDDDEH